MEARTQRDVLSLIKERQSIRRYTEEDIAPHQIDTLLEAARWAPSGGNRQPWHFYVVRDQAMKDAIATASREQTFIASAPVVIVVCAVPEMSAQKYMERGRDLYCIQDTAAAIQNILLAAWDLGLGTCWCGAFDDKALAQAIGAHAGHRPVAVLPIGHPERIGRRTERREIMEFTTYIGP